MVRTVEIIPGSRLPNLSLNCILMGRKCLDTQEKHGWVTGNGTVYWCKPWNIDVELACTQHTAEDALTSLAVR